MSDELLKKKRDAEIKLLNELIEFEKKTGMVVGQIFITRDAEKSLTDLRLVG